MSDQQNILPMPAENGVGLNFDQLMEKVGLKGWSEMNKSPAAPETTEAQKKAAELPKRYARLFSGNGTKHDADAVLDDLLGQTLHRAPGPAHVAPGAQLRGFEATALYIAERTGQNGMMYYIAEMVRRGREAPKTAKKKSTK